MIGLLSLLCTAVLPWCDQKMEGWYYFEEKFSNETLEPEEAREILEVSKQQLQELLALAILTPTGENVSNYLRCQNFWTKQSALLAKTWGQVAETMTRQENLRKAAETHFLLFCFQGADPRTEAAALCAMEFVQEHGWILKAVSLDGIGISFLPEFEEDRGIAQRLSIRETPSCYIVDPNTQKIRLVGSGSLELAELEESIILQLGVKDD